MNVVWIYEICQHNPPHLPHFFVQLVFGKLWLVFAMFGLLWHIPQDLAILGAGVGGGWGEKEGGERGGGGGGGWSIFVPDIELVDCRLHQQQHLH